MIQKIISIAVIVVIISSVSLPLIDSLEGSDDSLIVVVLAGQSNDQYIPAYVDMNLTNQQGLPDRNVYYYGDNAPIFYLTPDKIRYDTTFASYGIHSMLNNSNTAWKIGLTDAEVALKLSEKYDADVLVINVSIGGATTDYLLPNHLGGTYTDNVINRALGQISSNYKNIIKAGWVWVHGETEGNNLNPEEYTQNFKIIESYYQSKGFDTCYMVKCRNTAMGDLQQQICNNDPNVIMASTAPTTFTVANGLLYDDNTHYTAKGRIIVGSDVAAAIDVPVIKSNDYDLIMVMPILLILVPILLAARMMYVRKN